MRRLTPTSNPFGVLATVFLLAGHGCTADPGVADGGPPPATHDARLDATPPGSPDAATASDGSRLPDGRGDSVAADRSVRDAAPPVLRYEVAFPQLSFTRPVDLQSPTDGLDRLFVLEQQGRILVFANQAAVASSSVFLDLRAKVNAYDDVQGGNEEGLLGLAFHPQYATNGHFYVNYTAYDAGTGARRTVIARYTASSGDPNRADPASALSILEFPQPYSNHNGGALAFGPDGYLYLAVGDGGSGGDPQNHGQRLDTLLGKILRIDVNAPSGGRNYGIPADNPFIGRAGARGEIWAYGLRNPWRISFDPPTGRLYAGDVGQGQREEIDLITKGGNYGWRIMEGTQCYGAAGCNQTGLIAPLVDYRVAAAQSVTGGYVYRGPSVPSLVGAYVYADFVGGQIWRLDYDGTLPAQSRLLFSSRLQIASFGQDKRGELYFLAFDGRVYRFRQ